MRKALIVWGGWLGHQPREVADIFHRLLTELSFQVTVSHTLEAFRDPQLGGGDALSDLHLIVPIWTMGKITPEQQQPVYRAVREFGVGIAGCHGGMCDAFRESTEWQFMTGGQWVAHPGNDGVKYRIHFTTPEHDITRGLNDFDVASEQYYLHVDPAVRILATTRFPTQGVEGPHTTNGPVDMPQLWTKMYGKGRVFYNALGHQANIFDIPEALELMRRGFQWAARAE